MDILNKLYQKTKKEEECYIWTGALMATGEPVVNKKAWGHTHARQLAYSLAGGTLKKDTKLISSCKNKLCINPSHLSYTHTPSNLYTEFMNQVNVNGGLSPDTSKAYLGQCWKWTGCLLHGRAYLNKEKWGEHIGARWIYKHTKNLPDLSSKITVNHRCNNEICVNPSHLYHIEGDTFNKANMKQALEDNRVYKQVFTLEQVKEVRQKIANGARTSVLCKEYNCSKVTIANVKYNRSYYDPEYTPPPN